MNKRTTLGYSWELNEHKTRISHVDVKQIVKVLQEKKIWKFAFKETVVVGQVPELAWLGPTLDGEGENSFKEGKI